MHLDIGGPWTAVTDTKANSGRWPCAEISIRGNTGVCFIWYVLRSKEGPRTRTSEVHARVPSTKLIKHLPRPGSGLNWGLTKMTPAPPLGEAGDMWALRTFCNFPSRYLFPFGMTHFRYDRCDGLVNVRHPTKPWGPGEQAFCLFCPPLFPSLAQCLAQNKCSAATWGSR